MRLVTYLRSGARSTGLVCDDRVIDLPTASEGRLPPDMISLLAVDGWRALAADVAAMARKGAADLPADAVTPLVEAQLLAPVPRPGKIMCLGLNYSEHAAEGGEDVPAEPIVFGKASTSVIGPGADIVLPEASAKVDYEAELAVVIGRRTKLVSAADALKHVAGYTVLNDVSARDYQNEKPGGQWFLGKSFDTFCPLGPWLVTPDEIPDPQALDIACEVSGRVMQASSTAHMVFGVASVIEYLSRVFTLEVGDIIGTGTPSGVGQSRTPPRFLRSGDVVRCTIENIGTLENAVL